MDKLTRCLWKRQGNKVSGQVNKLFAKRDRVTCEQSIRSFNSILPVHPFTSYSLGYLAFYSPPLGGGARGRGCLLLSLSLLFFFFSVLYQHFIGGATSSLTTFLQYILFDKVVEVTSCGILRTVIYLVPLRGSQFPFKTIEEHVEHLSLSVV